MCSASRADRPDFHSQLNIDMFIPIIFSSSWSNWLIWFTYAVQASGMVFGPRGMYCSNPTVDDQPKLAMHFTPMKILHAPDPVHVGEFKMYGLSTSGTYATIDWNKIRYSARKVVPQADPKERTTVVNIRLPTNYVVEPFSKDIGLGPKDLVVMNYTSESGILAKTSKGLMVLTYDACWQGLVRQRFCATLDNGIKLELVFAPKGSYHHLYIYAAGQVVYGGLFVLDSDEVPMNISLVKFNEKYLDRLLDIMLIGTEAYYEHFWNRGRALRWDPLRSQLTLNYGEWVNGNRGPRHPEAHFTQC